MKEQITKVLSFNHKGRQFTQTYPLQGLECSLVKFLPPWDQGSIAE